MTKFNFDPKSNYLKTREDIGYVTLKQATQADYDRIGFMSGLEVHQQLLTKYKLFCRCPAGVFNRHEEYDAELVRHMRPTLSELGEYDGTALMEFKTKKEIIYRIKNETACTYDVDDTPPFKIDQEALNIAIGISLLSKLNIVGEVHITRKQYLDGSIPTGFQRTAIIGVEGEIPLRKKKIRLIQLSLEEDSCREMWDIGHQRGYKTDRLGMPLIETVTYPDCTNPQEVREACNYIRFLNRSTGKVRTGIGAGREDVNVSCRGGSRVEIKGVAHTKWIPSLTHNESFRQWALLNIRDILTRKVKNHEAWTISHKVLSYHKFEFKYKPLKEAGKEGHSIVAVNLPDFHGILSHFTQPDKIFADEISERLKVIACIEKPHMAHTEDMVPLVPQKDWEQIRKLLKAKDHDAQLIFWGPDADVATALEVIEERCKMAFEGVPNETRKSFEDGTTIFERVLPGADRMYPDTDSAPIPLEEDLIIELGKNLPTDIIDRYHQLVEWKIPKDTYTYIFSKNLYPIIESIIKELKIDPTVVGTFFGHHLKWVEGRFKKSPEFKYEMIRALFRYLKNNKLDLILAGNMLPVIYENPKMDFESVLTSINFRRISKEDILAEAEFLCQKFNQIGRKKDNSACFAWIMGQLRKVALGNYNLTELSKEIKKMHHD
jgi:glutamyl-tRNA(Gln) amidotransferase subunit E